MNGDLERVLNSLRMIQGLKVDGEELADEKPFTSKPEDEASSEESCPAC